MVAEPERQQILLTAHAVAHTEDDVVPAQQPSQVLRLADPSSLGPVSPEVCEGPSTRGC